MMKGIFRTSLKALSCAIPLIAASDRARSEGAVQRLSCETLTSCTHLGECQATNEQFEFLLTPIVSERTGEKTFEIAYGEQTSEVEQISIFGPYAWADDEYDMQILSISGPDHVTWLRSDLGKQESVTLFLYCEDES